jgi:tRNA U34 5-methylaminomethyl-2-thiouridine-forming methyltransferase MnmC
MQREIILTEDGSPSIWVPDLQETYHSRYGAIRESRHVFIEAGLLPFLKKQDHIRLLEIGFGSGLNALLTLKTAQSTSASIYYETLEPFPLNKGEIDLFLQKLRSSKDFKDSLRRLHAAPWEQEVEVEQGFLLKKRKLELENFQPDEKFHLLYFDAFSPDVQPALWTLDVFRQLYNGLLPAGVLCTYCSKSSVRRNMLEAGFLVEKLPGPPGKREMLRGTKDQVISH